MSEFIDIINPTDPQIIEVINPAPAPFIEVVYENVIEKTTVTDARIFTGIAGETLGGGKLVYYSSGAFYLYDSNNTDLADRVFGLTVGAASINQNVDVQISGIFTEVGLGLTPDENYYAGINGLITNDPSPYAVCTLIGVAIDSDNLKLSIQQSIITV